VGGDEREGKRKEEGDGRGRERGEDFARLRFAAGSASAHKRNIIDTLGSVIRSVNYSTNVDFTLLVI
jgi:hypothetical protein